MSDDPPGPPALRTAGRARWSVSVHRAGDDAPLWARHPHRVLSTASVAKVLLLVEVAAQIADGRLDPAQLVGRDGASAAADSGLWQWLRTAHLPVADLAVLVAAVSDNWATNALLTVVPLPQVARRAAALGLADSGLDDRVRDVRGRGDPDRLSHGSAADWSCVMLALATQELVSPAVSRQLTAWLRLGVDLSMVAGGLGLDPLAHHEPDRTVRLCHKTGTDDGVRADVGVVTGDHAVAYACLANWDPDGPDLRDEVLADMRTIGRWVARAALPGRSR